MIRKLTTNSSVQVPKKSPTTNSVPDAVKVEKLIQGIQARFETHMNDDLDTKQAFSAVQALLKELSAYDRQGLLSQDSKAKLLASLKKIDSVWGVLF